MICLNCDSEEAPQQHRFCSACGKEELATPEQYKKFMDKFNEKQRVKKHQHRYTIQTNYPLPENSFCVKCNNPKRNYMVLLLAEYGFNVKIQGVSV